MPKEIKNTFNIYLPCYYVDVRYKYTEKERKMNPLEMIVLTIIMLYQQKNSAELIVDIFDSIPYTYDIHFPTEWYSNLLNELLTTRGILKSDSTILEELKVSDISISEQTREFYKKQCIVSEEKSDKDTLYQPYLTTDKLEIVKDKRKKELSSLIQVIPRGAYYPVDNIPELTDSKIKDTINLEGDYNSIEITNIKNVETYTKGTCLLTISANRLSLDIGITEWDKHLKELPTDFIQENIIDKAFEKDESFSRVEWDNIENTQDIYLATSLDRGETWTCSNGNFDYKSDSIRFVIGDEFAYDKQYITIPLLQNYLLEDGVFFDSTTIYKNRLVNVESFEAGRTVSIPLNIEDKFDSRQFVEDLSNILIDESQNTDESKDLVVITTLLYLVGSEADKVLIKCLKNDDALYRDNNFFDSLPFSISDELKEKIQANIDESKIFTFDTLTEQLDFIKESKNMDLISKLFEYHSIDNFDDITNNDELADYLRQNKFPELNQDIDIEYDSLDLDMDILKKLFELNILNKDKLIQSLNNKELFYELLDDYNTLNKEFLQMIPNVLREAFELFDKDISEIENDFASLKRIYSIYKQLQDKHHNRRNWLVEYYKCEELIKLSRLCDQFHGKEVFIWDTNALIDETNILSNILKTNSKSRIHIIPKCILNELDKLKHGKEDRNKKAREVNKILNDNNLKNVVSLSDIDSIVMVEKQNRYLSVDDTLVAYVEKFAESHYGEFCSKIVICSKDNNLCAKILSKKHDKVSIHENNTKKSKKHNKK